MGCSRPASRISSRKASLWANFALILGRARRRRPEHRSCAASSSRKNPPWRRSRRRRAGCRPCRRSPFFDRLERKARDNGDAVIALLAVEREMGVAEPLEPLCRKAVVRALGLLQAEHVGHHRAQEAGDEIDAQAHRVDVPGGDGEAHRRSIYMCVIAGLVPATPIMWHGRALVIGVAGTSPAMTVAMKGIAAKRSRALY